MKNKKIYIILIIFVSIILGVTLMFKTNVFNIKKLFEVKISKELKAKVEDKDKKDNEDTKKEVNTLKRPNPRPDANIQVTYTDEMFEKSNMIKNINSEEFVLIEARIKEIKNDVFGDFGNKFEVKTELGLENVKILNRSQGQAKEIDKIYFDGGKASLYEKNKWKKKLGLNVENTNKSEEEQKKTEIKTIFPYQIDFKVGEEYVFLLYKEPSGKYLLSELRTFKKIEETKEKVVLQNINLPDIKIEKIGEEFK